ncbi:hypothetical protein J2S13_000932 [Oikeobacillus pervagus]|uniref:Uncharacterized protein n=1 Tax=Oikeobacillus pervagus TaxID=1325931 RepID=A0AAJ1T3E6_9BACI|nr:hypothetical protein [Oikeobacillus pervagus]MDQ0214536.1 hypothetical protein [Oikeobacillus pervagus]
MTKIITLLLSIFLIIPILYLIPLSLSVKGRMVITSVTVFIVLMGFFTQLILPLWQVFIILIILLCLSAYFLNKYGAKWLFEQTSDEEIVEEIGNPAHNTKPVMPNDHKEAIIPPTKHSKTMDGIAAGIQEDDHVEQQEKLTDELHPIEESSRVDSEKIDEEEVNRVEDYIAPLKEQVVTKEEDQLLEEFFDHDVGGINEWDMLEKLDENIPVGSSGHQQKADEDSYNIEELFSEELLYINDEGEPLDKSKHESNVVEEEEPLILDGEIHVPSESSTLAEMTGNTEDCYNEKNEKETSDPIERVEDEDQDQDEVVKSLSPLPQDQEGYDIESETQKKEVKDEEEENYEYLGQDETIPTEIYKLEQAHLENIEDNLEEKDIRVEPVFSQNEMNEQGGRATQLEFIDEKMEEQIEDKEVEIVADVEERMIKEEKKVIHHELLTSMLLQIEMKKQLLPRSDYEAMIKSHLHTNLHDRDYFIFAKVLLASYMESENEAEFRTFTHELEEKFRTYPFIMKEIATFRLLFMKIMDDKQ